MGPKIKVLGISIRLGLYAYFGFSRFDQEPDTDDHINYRYRQYNACYISAASIARFYRAQQEMLKSMPGVQ